MNLAVLCGNLGQDPELKHTQSGKAVASFNVATSKKINGQDVTQWHRIIVWEKLAESCAKYLAKGKKALIEGEITYRSWDDKDGQKRYMTEIIAHRVEFLTPAGERETSPASRQDDPPF